MSGNIRGAEALKAGYAYKSLITRRQAERTFELCFFTKSDESVIASEINDLWGFECSEKNKELSRGFGYAYLYYNLAFSKFRVTAVVDGCPAGVVCAGKHKVKVPNLLYLAKALKYFLPLLFCKEFTPQIKAWKTFYKEVKSMENSLQREYNGELYLLVTSKRQRGMGLGKKLLSSAKEYFCANGMSSFLLHTDTECNYKFYESQGLSRVCSRCVKEGQNPWEIYLYANE